MITRYTHYGNSRSIDLGIGINGDMSPRDNIQEKFREESNFPLYRARESGPAESSRPEVALRGGGAGK